MSRSANPTAIGAFVIGAVCIGVAALTFFGSGRWFQDKRHFVCIFRENVDGLQEGSRVTFKGVRIGRVEQVILRFESNIKAGGVISEPSSEPLIPVVFSINANRLVDDVGLDIRNDGEFNRAQVEAGLRGKLKTTSLITGLLTLDLDYYPNDMTHTVENTPTSITFQGETIPVIPSVPSDLTALKERAYQAINNLGDLDFKQMIDDLSGVLTNLRSATGKFDVEGLNEAIAAFKSTVSSSKIGDALSAVENAADDLGDAAEGLRAEVHDWEIGALVAESRETVAKLKSAVSTAESLIAKGSTERGELERALTKFADASTEVEALAKMLQERPNSLIFGRKDEPSSGAGGTGDDARGPTSRRSRLPRSFPRSR